MTSRASDHYHHSLARLIQNVLRCKDGVPRVAQLAEEAGFSRFHLTRLFREVAGESLEQFLRRIRLERAAFLLRQTPCTVLEIAVECGYQSPEAFARSFRRSFGRLPSAYRTEPDDSWQLPAPTGLHWNAHWGTDWKVSWSLSRGRSTIDRLDHSQFGEWSAAMPICQSLGKNSRSSLGR